MSEAELHPHFFDLVGNVRAMRRLKSDPVPLELIRKVLQAGVQAPSGMNLQPWKFLLLAEPDSKRWFAERYAEAIATRLGVPLDPAERKPASGDLAALQFQMDHMHEFPYLLLVCGKRDWPFRVPEQERVGLAPPNYGAVYPCVQNILLACRAVGLGAAQTTMHQVFEEALCERFGIPDDYGVVSTIPIGWPLGRFGPVTRRPATECTYFDAWGNSEPSPTTTTGRSL